MPRSPSREQSYAALAVLYLIDWMGEDGPSLLPEAEACAPEKISCEERIKQTLLDKFSAP